MFKFIKLYILSILVWFPLFTSAFDNWIFEFIDETNQQVKTIMMWNTWITIKMDDEQRSYERPIPEEDNPCDDWWHAPSTWEWNNLITYRCHLNTECNPDNDLNYNDNLVTINNPNLAKKLKTEFNLSWEYRTSSPATSNNARSFIIDDQMTNYWESDRNNTKSIRCIRDSIIKPSYPNNIITKKQDWSHIIIWNNISLEVASWNLEWTFYRWKKEPDCIWDNCNIQYNSWTNSNNLWGWGDDTYTNWFDSWNPRGERQWLCTTWWHVPSRWELNSLLIARCNLSDECDTNTDLIAENDNNSNITLIKIGWSAWNSFKNYFNMWWIGIWSSSVNAGSWNEKARSLWLNDEVSAGTYAYRYKLLNIRCFKDFVDATYKVEFKSDWNVITWWIFVKWDTLDLTQYIVTKTGMEFVWWNTDSEAITKIDDSNNYEINEDVTLYAIFREPRNTATLTENTDWSKTIKWNNINLTIAWSDLPDTYSWGTTDPSQSGISDKNAWWWSGDIAANWFDSWNSRIERQWPCPSWWHIPSKWEWTNIIMARCHLESNNCEDNNLNYRYNGNVIEFYLSGVWLWSQFVDEFWLIWSNNLYPYYWTSSPANYYFYSVENNNDYIYVHETTNDIKHIRCVRNPSKTVRFDANGGTTTSTSTEIAEWLTLDLTHYIANKNGYDFIWWGESSTSTTKVDDNYIITWDITLYAIFQKKSSEWSSSWWWGSSSGWWSRSSEWSRSSGWSSSRSEWSSNSASSKNEITLTTNKKTLNTDEYINLTIETTNKYLGKLTLYAEYETPSSGRSAIPNTSHTYFSDFSNEWSDGYYRMVLSDHDEVTLKRLLKFTESGYYRVYVKDTYWNSKYIQFHVKQSNQNTNSKETINTNTEETTNISTWNNNYLSIISQLYKTQEDSHYSADEVNTSNINSIWWDEIYVSRSCKSYRIQYIESLNAYTSPDLKKTEYFVNIDYFKRYIDSKNSQNAECYANRSRITDSYSDTNTERDRAIAPNGKIYFIEQQNDWYSSKQFSSAKSFSSISELKEFINKHNPLTKIN